MGSCSGERRSGPGEMGSCPGERRSGPVEMGSCPGEMINPDNLMDFEGELI